MRRFELVGLSIVSLLVFYRIFVGMEFHVFMRVFTTLLAIFYMWFGLYIFNNIGLLDVLQREKRKILTPFRIISSVTAGFIYSFSFIAVLSALDFYGNMNTILSIAWLINLLALLAGIYFQKKIEPDKNYVKQFIIRSFIFTLVLFAVWLIPVDKRLETLYKDHPSFIEAYKNYTANPDDPEALSRLREERSAFRP
jgi:hypothetical protein